MMNSFEANFYNGHAAACGCNFRARLGAYHDGELQPGAATQVEEHLSSCAACRAELEDLRELSALAGLIGADGISPVALKRIHRAIDAEPQFSILRIAGILSGLAASVLVVGSAWLSEGPDSRPAPPTKIVIEMNRPQDWMTVASTLETPPLPRAPWEMRDQQMLADARFSSWMVEGLTGRQP